MNKLPVSSKVIAQTVVALAAGVACVVTDLQEQGLETPGWVAIGLTILSPIVGYLKAENNPAPSALR